MGIFINKEKVITSALNIRPHIIEIAQFVYLPEFDSEDFYQEQNINTNYNLLAIDEIMDDMVLLDHFNLDVLYAKEYSDEIHKQLFKDYIMSIKCFLGSSNINFYIQYLLDTIEQPYLFAQATNFLMIEYDEEEESEYYDDEEDEEFSIHEDSEGEEFGEEE